MKKSWLILILAGFVLAGCGQESPEEEALVYLESNAQILNASTEIDKLLTDELKKIDPKKMDTVMLVQRVENARESQQQLYEVLQAGPVDKAYQKGKIAYLHVVNGRIEACNEYLRALEASDAEGIARALEKQEKTDASRMAKALVDVNAVAEALGESPKESLVPETEK